jgi:hypothetical protein
LSTAQFITVGSSQIIVQTAIHFHFQDKNQSVAQSVGQNLGSSIIFFPVSVFCITFIVPVNIGFAISTAEVVSQEA